MKSRFKKKPTPTQKPTTVPRVVMYKPLNVAKIKLPEPKRAPESVQELPKLEELKITTKKLSKKQRLKKKEEFEDKKREEKYQKQREEREAEEQKEKEKKQKEINRRRSGKGRFFISFMCGGTERKTKNGASVPTFTVLREILQYADFQEFEDK